MYHLTTAKILGKGNVPWKRNQQSILYAILNSNDKYIWRKIASSYIMHVMATKECHFSLRSREPLMSVISVLLRVRNSCHGTTVFKNLPM